MDVEQINKAIAKYFCTMIHCKLAGKVPLNIPNRYNNYMNLVDSSINELCMNPSVFIAEMRSVISQYNTTTRDIISVDMLIDEFVHNFNFEKVYNKLSGAEKVKNMMYILHRTLMSYFKWICKSDPQAFLTTELTAEQKINMQNRMERKIRHNGVISQFGIYKKDNETVPKKLFDKLRKEYTRLKEEDA
jgi:hypothetical protein